MNRKPKLKRSKIPSKDNYLIVKVDESGVNEGLHPKGKRIYVTINAFVFSLNEAYRRFGRMKRLLIDFNKQEQLTKPLTKGNVTISLDCPHRNEIVSLAWDIVDWLARTRKILGSLAGIPKRGGQHSAMMQALADIPNYRDMLQHYDSDVIQTMVQKTFPIMGSILVAYCDGGEQHGRVILSTPARYAGDPTVSVAGVNSILAPARPPIDNITLSIANANINLSKVFNAIDSARDGIHDYLKERYDFDWESVDEEFTWPVVGE